MTKPLLLFLATAVALTTQAQALKTEDANLKGWTKDAKILYSDFKGKPSDKIKKYNKEIGLQASAQVGLRSILDVPKRKRDRGPLLEKVFIAPFFVKTGSVTFTADEKELDKQRLYFDMGEVVARMMRKELQQVQDSLKAYGTLWIMYSRVRDFYCEKFGQMVDQYTYDVFIGKKEGAYEQWRHEIDKLLTELNEYYTKPEDCHRLLTGKPIDPKYEQSETVMGSSGCSR